MDENRPIDRKRESGGEAEIGSHEDGAVVEMIPIQGRLIVVKTKSIYEMAMADDIDPNRTNIGLPTSIQKLIVKQGSDSEIVSKTFLTAKTLFKSSNFEKAIDTDRILKLSIEMLEEFITLEREIEKYLAEEKRLIEEYNSRKDKSGSYSIPSIMNLETECKTIFQKADHIEQILMEIVTVFYPNDGLTKQSHFPRLYDVLKVKYGENDRLTEFIHETLPFMKVVRELRNALDHRLKAVTICNFDIQPDSTVLTPTIELRSKTEKLNRTPLSEFLPMTLKNMLAIVEAALVLLASKNVKSNALSKTVKEIPKEIRRNPNVRYCFWLPFGQDGFYDQ